MSDRILLTVSIDSLFRVLTVGDQKTTTGTIADKARRHTKCAQDRGVALTGNMATPGSLALALVRQGAISASGFTPLVIVSLLSASSPYPHAPCTFLAFRQTLSLERARRPQSGCPGCVAGRKDKASEPVSEPNNARTTHTHSLAPSHTLTQPGANIRRGKARPRPVTARGCCPLHNW